MTGRPSSFTQEKADEICGRTLVYAVFRMGGYRHECGGIFSSPEQAITVAKSLAVTDADSHHDYEVVPFTLNHPVPTGGRRVGWNDRGDSPGIHEADPIFTCDRDHPEGKPYVARTS